MNSAPDRIYDVALVGAGPCGLAMAIALKQADVSYIQLDRAEMAHTINWFPQEMKFFSSGDLLELGNLPLSFQSDRPTKEEYLRYLRGVVDYYDLKINTYEQVDRIEGKSGNFTLHCQRKDGSRHEYRSKILILAVGSTARPNLLGIPGEDMPHVSHYFIEPHRYYGRRVLIVGGRNSTADAALRLYHNGASEVIISYRGEELHRKIIKYWILPEINTLITEGQVEAHFTTVPVSIDAEKTVLRNIKTGREFDVGCDFVLLFTGYLPDYTLLEQLGLRYEGADQEPLYNERTMQATVTGVYLCGTITTGARRPDQVFIENARFHYKPIIEDVLTQLKRQ